MRLRRRYVIILTLFILFFGAGVVSAREVFSGELCNIPADRVITGDVFVLCTELVMDGHIEGRLMGAARSAVINGQVDGNVYLLAAELDMQGRLGKDLHFAGLALNINNPAQFDEAGSSLITVNLSCSIASGVNVPGSIIGVGYQLLIDGDVGHEVSFWGSSLTIGGHVTGDVDVTVGDSESNGVSNEIGTLLIPFTFIEVELVDPGLIVTDRGSIDGRLHYRSPNAGVIDGVVAQPVSWDDTSPVNPFVNSAQRSRGLQEYLSRVFRDFITLGFIGAVGLILSPRIMQAPLKPLQAHPVATLGVGMLSFIMSFPIVLLIFLLSIAIILILRLLPLDTIVLLSGVVLGLANIGGAGLFYFTAIFIARVIVALAIGRGIVRLLGNIEGNGIRYQFLNLGTGLLILAMLGAIPVIGWGFNALALFLGLGAVLSVVRNQVRKLRDAGKTPPPPSPMRYSAEGFPLLPYFAPDGSSVIIDETSSSGPPAQGMDNLPEGFEWWDE